MSGRLIVFEGGEGAGKTTQLAKSDAWLVESGWLSVLQSKGYIQRVVVSREPGGTAIGQNIRRLLLEPASPQALADRTELLLYAADRAQHVEEFLQPQLNQGALILCDRFTDSTIAYQGYGRGLALDLIRQLNQIATNGLQSDLTLWLDLDPEIGLTRTKQRGTLDRLEKTNLAFHRRVREGFAQLAQQHPQRIVRIDANQPEAQVTRQVQDVLKQAFDRWFGENKGLN